MKKLKFIKHPGGFNLAYHPFEVGMFEEKQAAELIGAGVCIAVEESDLPEDLPGRNYILKAGLSLEELKEIKDFTEIPGIKKNIAEKLTTYFNPES